MTPAPTTRSAIIASCGSRWPRRAPSRSARAPRIRTHADPDFVVYRNGQFRDRRARSAAATRDRDHHQRRRRRLPASTCTIAPTAAARDKARPATTTSPSRSTEMTRMTTNNLQHTLSAALAGAALLAVLLAGCGKPPAPAEPAATPPTRRTRRLRIRRLRAKCRQPDDGRALAGARPATAHRTLGGAQAHRRRRNRASIPCTRPCPAPR